MDDDRVKPATEELKGFDATRFQQPGSPAHSDTFPRFAGPGRGADTVPTSQTYSAIVRAAKELIRTNGYTDLTVDDVRRRAGISRASFYFYFRNKTHLLMQVGNFVMAELYEVAGKHYPEQDEYTRIVLANVGYLSVWHREREILGQLFALSLVDKDIRAFYARCRAQFEQRVSARIARLISQARIPAVNADLLAATLSSMVEFSAYRFFVMQDDEMIRSRVEFQDLVKVLSENWYCAVYGKPAPEGHQYARYQLAASGPATP